MFCPKCGNDVGNNKFCANCGAAVTANGSGIGNTAARKQKKSAHKYIILFLVILCIAAGAAGLYAKMFFSKDYIPDEKELHTASMLIGESNVGKMLCKKARDLDDGTAMYRDSLDDDTAMHLYALAADYGSPEAQYRVGYDYYANGDDLGDYKKAFELFEKSAAAGNADAMYMLSWFYGSIDDISPTDYNKYPSLLKKAADAGNVLAMMDLVYYYLYYTKDVDKGKELIKKTIPLLEESAMSGNHMAKLFLGDYYYYVEGSDKKAKGEKMIKESADYCGPIGKSSLAAFMLNANNVSSAIKLYKQLMDDGFFSVSQLSVLSDYREEICDKIEEELKPFSDSGNIIAKIALSLVYSYDSNHEPSESFSLVKSCSHDSSEAMRFLGQCYEFGVGTEKNSEQARKLYKKALSWGNPSVKRDIERLESSTD